MRTKPLRSIPGCKPASPGIAGPGVTALALLLLSTAGAGCSREETPATSLPTRQTTIDPVKAKLEAAQQDAERRRTEGERAGQ